MKKTMNSIHEKTIKIGYSTLDHRGNLKIVSIMNFLQDAASEHAAQMGVSGFDLARKNLGWVISRYHIEINHYPAWQESIHIKTFRFPYKNLYEMREMTLCSSNDKTIQTKNIQAKVCWVMVNKHNGRPLRLSRFMESAMCEPMCGSTFETMYKAIAGSKYDNYHPESRYHFPDIEKPLKTDLQLPFKVRMHDLDLNGHVNNAIFVEWAVETVPEEVLSQYTPMTIDVIFHKESLYGDSIISRTDLCKHLELQTLLTRHVIIRKKDLTELAYLNIKWRRLER